jgi:hypothetical protein
LVFGFCWGFWIAIVGTYLGVTCLPHGLGAKGARGPPSILRALLQLSKDFPSSAILGTKPLTQGPLGDTQYPNYRMSFLEKDIKTSKRQGLDWGHGSSGRAPAYKHKTLSSTPITSKKKK